MINIKDRLRSRSERIVNDCVTSQLLHEAADHIATLEASVAANQKDAINWRKFSRVIRSGHLRGAGHGNRIKIVKTCPMYGEDDEISLDDVMKRIADTSTQEVG